MGPGKTRVDLIPTWPLLRVADAFAAGCSEERPPNDWKRPEISDDDFYAATLRHLFAWRDGELVDLKSRQLHLAHAAADILILLERYNIRQHQDSWIVVDAYGVTVGGPYTTQVEATERMSKQPGTHIIGPVDSGAALLTVSEEP